MSEQIGDCKHAMPRESCLECIREDIEKLKWFRTDAIWNMQRIEGDVMRIEGRIQTLESLVAMLQPSAFGVPEPPIDMAAVDKVLQSAGWPTP